MGFTSGMQGCLSTHKSINMTHHINRIKDNNYIVLIDAQKQLTKFSIPYDLLLFSCSVISNSLQPHGLQHARLPCPSPSPGSLLKLMFIESVMPSNHLILCQSPSSPAFSLSQHQGLFQWVGSLHQVQSIGASGSASVIPMNIQDWFPSGVTG